MKNNTSRYRLDRIVAGIDSGEFELLRVFPLSSGKTLTVAIELRRTPKRLEPGSGKPRRPRGPVLPGKQQRELIFEEDWLS